MKKFLFLIPMLVISCKKDPTSLSTDGNSDSLGNKTEFKEAHIDSTVPKIQPESDSLPISKPEKQNRKIVADTIYRTFQASELPLNFSEEFQNERQQLILKIEHFSQPEISAEILPENNMMNIRFNQIRIPNGDWDGPFGRTLEKYPVSSKGELLLRIGKSNMASGKASGKFSVKIK